jgi:hypothetical protein
MKIFAAEIEDGLEHRIATSASITYACLAEPVADTGEKQKIKEVKSIASVEDSDLYYVQSILVSSSWNKNDDIFDKVEVWKAKDTPEDKPTNLEHDESVIIGHITANWPITEDGSPIDMDTSYDYLPDKYHIVTGSVIYRGFSNPELRDRAEKLIAEIESGNKFVSMECFFKGFDYGLINKTNASYQILPRSDKTAHLTKYLRSYGGTGEHDNYKIGRVLRDITFSGKGFVNKPANPDSIIFSQESISNKKNLNLTETGVSMNKSTSTVENIEMSSETTTQAEEVVTETVETTPVVETEVVTTETEAATKTKEEMLKEEMMMKKKKEEETKKMKADFDESIAQVVSEKDTIIAQIKSELDAALEAIAGYKMKEQEMAKKEKNMKRKASLLGCGFDEATSEATIEKFDSLADDAFDAMTTLFAGKMPPWLEKIKKGDDEETDKTKDGKKKASVEETVDSSALENVVVEETVNLGVGSDVQSSVDSTRAELIEFVCARLGKKN